jgi:GTP diphosphokinase / guanosine-3',5'-bis(diphosphate) 3'-diphosphatase
LNGDEVEILRSDAQVPPPAWEAIAITGKAKAAIRRATRTAVRKQFAGLGREIVEKMLLMHKQPFDEAKAAKSVARLGHKSLSDALTAIGRGDLSSQDMLRAMGVEVEEKLAKSTRRKTAVNGKAPEARGSIPVRGVAANTVLKFHTKTGAVPGERIVGIITPGEGITIYPIFADALEQFDDQPERWIDLTWEASDETERFPARVGVSIINEVGALAQVTQVISEKEANIDELQMAARAGVKDFYDLTILLEVRDTHHLNAVMNELRTRTAVSQVARMTG